MRRDLRKITDAYVELCLRHHTVPHVNELASYLSFAPSTLCKRFRALAGVLPSAYMKRRQLAAAIHLLETTSLGIAAIAERSGFGTRETLFRTFRRILHSTPAAYRAENNVTSLRH